jgi:serine/threonine-protein kinase RsbW
VAITRVRDDVVADSATAAGEVAWAGRSAEVVDRERCQALLLTRSRPGAERCGHPAVARVRGTHRRTVDVCALHARIAGDRPRFVAEWARHHDAVRGRAAAAAGVAGGDHLRVLADAGTLSAVRRKLTGLLARARCDDETCARIILAVTEAVANAVEHGSPEGGRVLVGLRVDGDRARVSVSDEGRLGATLPLGSPIAPAPGRSRGRGRLVMCALTDRIGVESDGGGTTVTMDFAFPPGSVDGRPSG